MYQNNLFELIKSYESRLATSVPVECLNTLIDYLTVLEQQADKDFIAAAKKNVVQPEYRADALTKYGIQLCYKDVIERLKKIRIAYK